MPTPSLRGVYVPLITPFAADGSVAFDAIEALACEYLDAGAAGLVPLGTTGEAPLLDGDEKRAIVELCARIGVERDAQVIVGSGTNNTASTVEATMAYGAIEGVSHAMVVVPYYVRPSQAGIVAHVTAAADASPVPVVVYNIPIRSGRVLEAPGMLELAAHPNVVGVKQAVDGIDMATLEILAGAPRDFAVLGGDDPYLFPTVLLGGAGAICASAHVHRPVRADDRVRPRRQGRRGPRPPRGAAAGGEGLLHRAQPVGVQGRVARAGQDPDARPPPPAAARQRRVPRRRPRRDRGRGGLNAVVRTFSVAGATGNVRTGQRRRSSATWKARSIDWRPLRRGSHIVS